MKLGRIAIVSVVISVLLMMSILFATLFILPNNVNAEETENTTTTENTVETLDETEDDDKIVSGYNEAKDKATNIVEEVGLKEYLLEYFDENMTDLIITITISVLTAFIFLASIFFTVKKLITCIKKYGVESDATKEVMNQLTTQLKDTQTALTELETTKKLIVENNAELQQKIVELSNDNAKIQKVMKIAFGNDESLVSRGYATKINEIIEEE